jgi:hypothetical protein
MVPHFPLSKQSLFHDVLLPLLCSNDNDLCLDNYGLYLENNNLYSDNKVLYLDHNEQKGGFHTTNFIKSI